MMAGSGNNWNGLSDEAMFCVFFAALAVAVALGVFGGMYLYHLAV